MHAPFFPAAGFKYVLSLAVALSLGRAGAGSGTADDPDAGRSRGVAVDLSRGNAGPHRQLRAQLMDGYRVLLRWEGPGDTNEVLEIERRIGAGPFGIIGKTAPGASLYHDTAVTPGILQTYRIRTGSGTPAPDGLGEVSITRPSPTPGELVSWGTDRGDPLGRTPPGDDFVAVSAGSQHTMALRANGTLVVWGRNDEGQVSTAPTGGGFIQIDAGGFHCVALRADGSLAAWGLNSYGQVSLTPQGGGFVKVSAGGGLHGLALRADGTLSLWGHGGYGQLVAPEGPFLDADGGNLGSTAVREDGTLVYWGFRRYGQHELPGGNDFLSVQGGQTTSWAFRKDGSFVVWGSDRFLTTFTGIVFGSPSPRGIRSIVEGHSVGIALRADGSMLPWGRTDNGLVARTPGGAGFTAVAIGDKNAVAIRSFTRPRVAPFADGGFESAQLPPATALLSSGMDQRRLERWSTRGDASCVVTTGQFFGLQPVEGNTWVEFNADDAPVGGSLFQAFRTTVGGRYAVRYTAGKSGRGLGVMRIHVEVLSDLGRVLAQATNEILQLGWKPAATLPFTAASPETTVRFTDVSTDSFSANAALDAVSVESGLGDIFNIVSVRIPEGSCSLPCQPLIQQVWAVSAPPYPFNDTLGIGVLINQALESSSRPPEAFVLHDDVYASPNVPAPERAVITYQFDGPVAVDQVEIIQHENGITRVEGFVGDTPESLRSIGQVFGTHGDVTGDSALPEKESDVFHFNNAVRGSVFRLVITKTNHGRAYGCYRIFPRDRNGARFLGALAKAIPGGADSGTSRGR